MNRLRLRMRVLAVALVVTGSVLVVRLWKLQIVEADTWRARRAENLHRVEWLAPRRGSIEDRNGDLLACDEAKFVLNLSYRSFRRGHPLGLVVHLDHVLRELRNAGAAPLAPLVPGRPLGYSDPPERFHEALASVLRLPVGALLRSGPLDKRLRGVLRFYVFACLAAVPDAEDRRHGRAARIALALDRAPKPSGEAAVGSVMASLLVERDGGAEQQVLVRRVHAWLQAGYEDLAGLAGLLGPELVLPGTNGKQHGSLFAWLDALDAWFDRRTPEALAQARRRGAAELAAGAGPWARLRRALLSVGQQSAEGSELEQLLDQRFQLEHSVREISVGVSFDSVVALVLGRRERFPGFAIGERVRRRYPRLAHDGKAYRFLGVVSEEARSQHPRPAALLPLGDELDADLDETNRVHFDDRAWSLWKQQLEERARKRRFALERVGKNGVEHALDGVLTGREGAREVLRDRRGAERQSPKHLPARRGLNVRLTVDCELQDLLYDGLRFAAAELEASMPGAVASESRASFALIDARTGDILGMAWIPETQELASGTRIPFRFNTVARSFYQPYPGSVVKPFLAYEAVATLGAAADAVAPCTGRYRSRNGSVRCGCGYRGREPNVESALEYSCNSYFAQVGEKLGFAGVWRALQRFGLVAGPATFVEPFGLALERPRAQPKERWSLVHRAIGYGYRIAPLTIARGYAAIGTGRLPTLRFVSHVDGHPVESDPPRTLDLQQSAIRRVREGLRRVTLERGTARHAGLADFSIAAKTGTAEVQNKRANNAWFAGYLPLDAPRLAFACVFWASPQKVHGGGVAASAVAEFLRKLRENPALWNRYVAQR